MRLPAKGRPSLDVRPKRMGGPFGCVCVPDSVRVRVSGGTESGTVPGPARDFRAWKGQALCPLCGQFSIGADPQSGPINLADTREAAVRLLFAWLMLLLLLFASSGRPGNFIWQTKGTQDDNKPHELSVTTCTVWAHGEGAHRLAFTH